MRAVAYLIAAGALAMAGAAAAEPSAPPAPAGAAPPSAVVANPTVEGYVAPANPAEDPLVCRSETPIGSKLPVKTCMKKSERDRQKRDSQEALQLIQRRSDGPVKIEGPFQ